MINKSTLIFFFLLLMLPLSALAQEEAIKSIRQKIGISTKQNFREKLFVHTDKNFYLAGEIIWFKLYSVDALTNKPINFSKVAYVEVLERTGKPVLQTKLELTKKGGSGSLYLPVTLNSDNYIIRAYTSWMKTEGTEWFFEKSIGIVNTIKPFENKSQPDDSLQVMVAFFPEGGNLVQGLESKVGFKITDQYGRGIDARGIVTSESGDTVSRFSSYKFGIGNFQFKPGAGHQYKAIVLLPQGKTFSQALPVIYNQGYVMNVADNKDGRLKVRLQARGSDASLRGEKVFLLVHTRQSIKKIEAGFVNYESDLVFYVSKEELGDGINNLTLFNENEQPVCERLVFKKPVVSGTVDIALNKQVFSPRQKVELAVLTANSDLIKQENNYSVAVYQLDSLQDVDQLDISGYLWFGSEIKGNVEFPGFYFSKAEGAEEEMDNLLLTHGWRRFNWERLSPAGTRTPQFVPEHNGHLVAVRVTNVSDGKIAPNVNCFLSYSTTRFGLAVAKTDNRGIALFDVKNYYGPGEIIVQAGTEVQSNYRVEVLTPYSDEKINFPLPPIVVPKSKEKQLTEKSIAMQAQNIYRADSSRRFSAPAFKDTLPFFGRAEYTYLLDDYKRFTTMEEVLREYVTPINVILRNGKLYMTVYDEASKTVYNDQLLVLLDGVPLMDFQRIFSYDPLKVKRLEVVPRRYMVGGMNFKSIASFETHDGKFDGFELTPGLVAIDYDGLQLQREFYSPNYEKEGERLNRIPDFRSTLYWSPYVSVDESVKAPLRFYTSDKKGNYLIVLQGINSKGETIATTSTFKVE